MPEKMTETVKIYCENNNSNLFVNFGTTLAQVAEILALKNDHPFLAAYVNNRLKELDFAIYSPLSIRFIDITHFEGMRVYQRTLFFALQKATYDLFPENKLQIKHSVAKGFYCEMKGMDEVSEDDLSKITARMKVLVEQNIPIVRQKVTSVEAEEIYASQGFDDKVALLRTRPNLYVTMYSLADLSGFFYGALAPSTSYIYLFELTKYFKGFHIAVPRRSDPAKLEKMVPQDKMFDVFNEYTEWMSIIGVANIGALNSYILHKEGNDLIKIAEAFHEKKLGHIADAIFARHKAGGSRVILISGPSSSGKTTFAKRLGIQLRIMGLQPMMISLDDYFVDREKTPRDTTGEYDYEALEAIDLKLFNVDLKKLLAGEEVDIPRYDFITGTRTYKGNMLKLNEHSVLVIEGIHGLNPKLTTNISADMQYKIYVSALTSIAMDNLTRIATTDNRLLRRIVRDHRTRGANAVDTLRRWESVRRGEDKYIFPNQEQADIMFNSSLFYEISVLKSHIEPLLYEVPDTVPEFGEVRRLLKFLDQFVPQDGSEVPLTSILREFVGGSSFTY